MKEKLKVPEGCRKVLKQDKLQKGTFSDVWKRHNCNLLDAREVQ